MTKRDFSYMDVPMSLAHYKPHEQRYRDSMAEMLSEEIAFFKRNNLLREGAQALKVDFSEAQIMFSDFTDLGQDFLMSQQVEKWRAASDRRRTKNPMAKENGADLDRRLKKFLEQRKAASH